MRVPKLVTTWRGKAAAIATGCALAAAPIIGFAGPAAASGPWHIKEDNGSYYVGANTLSAGNPVLTVGSGSARNMTWDPTASTYYQGDRVGYWKFSNGNFMAATDDCGAITIKSDVTSNGVAWTIHAANGNLYLINRHCDQTYGSPDDLALAGRNTSGDQFIPCGLPFDCSGWYRAMSLIAA